ncbi:hypothetical protein GCM10017056_52410 [Seohaeicola zhoushanensis]|uniref:Uncharacterized protein n=1 Tax=Seohaeicola zhoushanensis TaxID=1569283 RepID=A0A8J3MB31_9RHOB|nr:hypothetical protein GCM10017056_52410 [Seohaeicola zhoushanensis]
MSERRVMCCGDIAILTYFVSAEKAGVPIYKALCTSTYINEDDTWLRLSGIFFPILPGGDANCPWALECTRAPVLAPLPRSVRERGPGRSQPILYAGLTCVSASPDIPSYKGRNRSTVEVCNSDGLLKGRAKDLPASRSY